MSRTRSLRLLGNKAIKPITLTTNPKATVPRIDMVSESNNLVDEETAIKCVKVETFRYMLGENSSEPPPDLAPVSDTSASSSSTLCKQCSDNCWIEHEYQPPKISWGTVKIRSYPILPGDHPDTLQGPPLTIDWNAVSEIERKIDDYEANRAERRHDDELRLTWLERRKMLRRVGVSEDAIYEAMEASSQVRQQRQRTASWRMKFDKVQEFQQAIRRSVGKTLYPKQRKALKTKY